MKNSFPIIQALLCMVCAAVPVFGTVTTFSGSIRQNTTWTDTMRLWGDVIVRDGAVLTIEPGTHVQFADTNRNAIFGTPDGIHLLALTSGAIRAEGVEYAPIVFGRDAAFARDGGWGKIQLIANDGLSSFRYCRFEFATTGLYAENTDGYSGTTELDIRDCTFRRCATAVFVGSGAAVSFSDSRIDSCDHGFSCHGASAVELSYLELSDNTSGILISGHPDIVTSGVINHVTVYGTNAVPINGGSASWWNGYGISFRNTAYPDFEVKNSIVAESYVANLSPGNWSVNEHNNCWYQRLMLLNIEGGAPGPNSITDDPLFEDVAHRVFRLVQPISPCLNTADDGTHMGAWQEPIAAPVLTRIGNDEIWRGTDAGQVYYPDGTPVGVNGVKRGVYLLYDGKTVGKAILIE